LGTWTTSGDMGTQLPETHGSNISSINAIWSTGKD